MKEQTRFPAEWELQSGVMLTWPHEGTDWRGCLKDAVGCFLAIAREIVAHEPLLIVTPEPDRVKKQLSEAGLWPRTYGRIELFTCETNDTWARDHAFISLIDGEGRHLLLDFCFNGWGLKFAAGKDNRINEKLYESGLLGDARYLDMRNIVLEGGSVESDGNGTLLTTAGCLLAPNRNYYKSIGEAERVLCEVLKAKRVLWLEHGHLSGDDTDGHVDTLARLCPDDTIVYVQCLDKGDEHYADLLQMEAELRQFRTADGKPYRLLPLPMADAVYEDGERLPATYANFLIINDAVLMPTYGQEENDAKAREVLGTAFPGREVRGVDCRVLIKQHGSLHCVTMQFPLLKPFKNQ